MPLHQTYLPFQTVTGNFTVSGYGARFLWSGQGTVAWTGTLVVASITSGASMFIKNVATGAPLFITGSVDYSLNYTVAPRATATFYSAGSTWLAL